MSVSRHRARDLQLALPVEPAGAARRSDGGLVPASGTRAAPRPRPQPSRYTKAAGLQRLGGAGATGLEPATSGVTGETAASALLVGRGATPRGSWASSR